MGELFVLGQRVNERCQTSMLCLHMRNRKMGSFYDQRERYSELNFFHLLCFCETPPGILHPALGSQAQGHCPVGASPEEGHQDD